MMRRGLGVAAQVRRRGLGVAVVAAAVVGVVAAFWALPAAARSRGDAGILALIPTPGYPALPHVVGDRIYEGTYDDPYANSAPSRVLEYTADGELLRSWTVQGQDLAAPHGVQVAANDSHG